MTNLMRPQPLREFRADLALVKIYPTRDDAGNAAALDVVAYLRERSADEGPARVVFAAAPSQNEFLAHLAEASDLNWSRISAFHMDEYLGLTPDHPASFRHYLRTHIFGRVGLRSDQIFEIAGEQVGEVLRICADYDAHLREGAIDLICGGIGENGHLAFNDPPVADFLDPVRVKAVRLDEACRFQQVHDGCFAAIDEVPSHAITLTIPVFTSAQRVSLVVPGERKAIAVRDTIKGPISESCPASILRRHPNAVIYLDEASARLV